MIETSDFERLRTIGLVPATLQQFLALDRPEGEISLLRVAEVQREGVSLHDGVAERPARLLPALRARLVDAGDAIAVGDWVAARCHAHGEWWVHERLPPLNQLARRLHDGRDKVTRAVIVSNVDTALLVMGLDNDYNPRRLERYLALVRPAALGVVVVLSKRDLCAVAPARLDEVRSLLPPQAHALALDALSDEPRAALAPWLRPGQTLVVLGSSGAGKSTLTNALAGAAVQATGASRSGDGRGRHTTTSRTLHTTPQGACIIDTPGLRTLRLDGDAQDVAAAFDDIGALALRCRFRDCRHEAEPGCAVRDSVGAERLRSYRKLLREAQRDRISALERKAQVQTWKARGRESRLRMAAKRG